MSGGRLVVVDRWGRDLKSFPLPAGSAIIGSDPSCDVRVLSPAALGVHATLAVRAAGAVLRARGRTTLNGAPVSVAALRHGDTLVVAGRRLRWDYDCPDKQRRVVSPAPCVTTPAPSRSSGRGRRRSEPARRIEPHALHRDSAPASSGRKQVAIVQPQRRDASEQNESAAGPAASRSPSPRGPRSDQALIDARKSGRNESPQPVVLDDPTKATLWIESRKTRSPRPSPLVDELQTSPHNTPPSRKRPSHVSIASPGSAAKVPRIATATPRGARGSSRSAPLRLAVLKKAHSAQQRVTKIQAPLKIDHTKQAAIMLMTGHAPRSRSRGASPASPASPASSLIVTPKRTSTYRTSKATKESVKKTSVRGRRSGRPSIRSPTFPSPKKSALKDPKAKRSLRKPESIKFDLSNLDNCSNLGNLENEERRINSEAALVDDTEDRSHNSVTEDDLTLHYSDTSSSKSPSPKKTILSRSSRIIERTLGSPMQTTVTGHSVLKQESPLSRKSLRGTIIVQKALSKSDSRTSIKTTKSHSDKSYSTPITSRLSEAISPRSDQKLETYSIIDLVSMDSNESGRSLYNSVESGTIASFGTPRTVASRQTRSKNHSLLGSSTPYSNQTLSPKTNSESTTNNIKSKKSSTTRKSTSVTTPENAQNISFNSTRISRPSRSRSRINDSEVLLVDEMENEDSSPRSSRRSNKSLLSPIVRKNISITVSPSESPSAGTITPENGHSPQDIGTPMLSIQSLLDQSSVNHITKTSHKFKNTKINAKRKTTGGIFTDNKRSRLSVKSRSLNLTQRRSLRARKGSSSSFNENDTSRDAEEVVTPKSAVKLVQEGVKNKHSTAKKPQSKRSLIDDLDDSDLVKELFNSPVKRKLSQSMTEFSRNQLYDDDDMITSRLARNTIAVAGRTPDNSLLEHTLAFTPEVFVSPLSNSQSAGSSPNLLGLKRLFAKSTPENDLQDFRGVKTMLRTPRAKKSINNDLCNVSGVKKIFARSPTNRLSDVRVKDIFVPSPKNDLRRVSGVKTLFQTTESTLEDLEDVKSLFRNSPRNDLRDISGVKRAMRANSPRNNLSDVRGVKQLFREQYSRNNISDVSGVEELFRETESPDTTFDQLLERPRLRAYTKSNSCSKINKKKKGETRTAKSLHDSIGPITDNVEAWLENELKKRAWRSESERSGRELRKLTIDTVEGRTPLTAGSRNCSGKGTSDGRQKSASEVYSARKLPIKKRSLVGRGGLLPLKKRPVLHSTPVKGREHTMNASELGRVSPIAIDDTRILQSYKEWPNPKAPTENNFAVVRNVSIVKTSPKRTRNKVGSSVTVETNVTRDQKINNNIPKKRGRPSVVIAKRTPVMSPQRSQKRVTRGKKVPNIENVQNSPKLVRSTRRKKQVVVSPKKTRIEVVKANLVSKLLPVVKLRAKRNNDKTIEEESKPKRTRNATVKKDIVNEIKRITNNNETNGNSKNAKKQVEVKKTIKIEPRDKRGRKNELVNEPKAGDDTIDVPIKKRGRKPKEDINVVNEPKAGGDTIDVPIKKRGRKPKEDINVVNEPKAGDDTIDVPIKKRGRKPKEDINVVNEPKAGDDTIDVPIKKRGRKPKEDINVVNEPKAGDDTIDVPIKKRGRKPKEDINVVNEPKVGDDTIDVPIKKRGRKSKKDINVSETRNRWTVMVQDPDTNTVVPKKSTRGRKGTAVEQKTVKKPKKVEIVAPSSVKKTKSSVRQDKIKDVDVDFRKSRRTRVNEANKNTSKTKNEQKKKVTKIAAEGSVGQEKIERRKYRNAHPKEEAKTGTRKKSTVPPAPCDDPRRKRRTRRTRRNDDGEEAGLEDKRRRTARAATQVPERSLRTRRQ